MSRPGKLHGFVCGNIARILGNFARQRKKGYVCTNETGIVVERDPDTVRGPDLMFFEDASSAADIERKFGQTPALLDVEVLSPNDTHGKIMKRVNEQLAFGTPLVWVVDCEAENVTVHRPGRAAGRGRGRSGNHRRRDVLARLPLQGERVFQDAWSLSQPARRFS